ncbi:sortase [Lactobacillus delbrueckii subsp. lactis]|nr:sortase [Lactobacillus delbrueckii subsp. lactis]
MKVNACSGYLNFPTLNLTLPVASKWRFSQLKVSPATYTGTAKDRDWTVAGHNFVNHFGRLNQLEVGDKVYFEDAAGQRYVYQVQKMEVLQPTAISKMVQSKYDLSLFTCTYDGTTRFTVRCRLLQIK